MKSNIILLFLLCITQQVQFNHGKKMYTGKDGAGSVWPKPKKISTSTNQMEVAIEAFVFEPTHDSKYCLFVARALERYEKIIRRDTTGPAKMRFRPRSDPAMHVLYYNLTSDKSCFEWPSLDMDESYSLTVQQDKRLLQADSVWGIYRGLETFSQLIIRESTGKAVINETAIEDEPRFKHRGLLIDTARHFLPMYTLYKIIDGMAYNKFNVLHWHIVDDQSFPYYSAAFPNLSGKGSYNPATHIYSQLDVASIVEYARDNGIRVIPEFDTPGHTQSWGKSQEGLLASCYDDKGEKDGTFGPIDPTKESNYEFMTTLWKELRSNFHDDYLHLGGDEVRFDCWKSNPDIAAWMKQMNITGDYAKLEEFHIQKVINISEQVGFNYIVWQEVIDNGVQANKDTVVEVWLPPADKELAKLTKMGYKTILAQPWYLDYIGYGQDWKNYYKYEPLNFDGTDEQKQLVMGGEACLWAEYVDSTNVQSRLWPRASAVAERLWSQSDVTDVDEAEVRLHQHRCRMVSRDIPAEPLYIGHCEVEYQDYIV